MKFQLPEQPSNATLDENYYLDYLQRLYRHIKGDDDWIAPSLQNSWVDYGSTWATAGYRLKNGFVEIQGLIKSGTATAGTLLFTLPEGYRPSAYIMRSVRDNASAYIRLDIYDNGNVYIQTAVDNTFLNLGGISFIAEQ